jgi:hypothetical protein
MVDLFIGTVSVMHDTPEYKVKKTNKNSENIKQQRTFLTHAVHERTYISVVEIIFAIHKKTMGSNFDGWILSTIHR